MNSEFRNYLVSYNYEGAKWNFEIKARDMDDARARMNRLCFAKLDGEIAVRIPVPSGRLGVVANQILGIIQSFLLPNHR